MELYHHFQTRKKKIFGGATIDLVQVQYVPGIFAIRYNNNRTVLSTSTASSTSTQYSVETARVATEYILIN